MSSEDPKQKEMYEAGREINRRAKAFQDSGVCKTYSEAMQKVFKADPKLFEKYSQAPVKRHEEARQAKSRQLTFSEGTHLDRAHRKNFSEMKELYPTYSKEQVNQQILASGGDGKRIFQALVGEVHADDIQYFKLKGYIPPEE